MLLTVKQIKSSLSPLSYEMVKYVRLKDNSFRFARAISADHSSMVSLEERPNVISAGTIDIRRDGLRWEGFGSITLDVKGDLCGDDESYLKDLFGMEFKSRW